MAPMGRCCPCIPVREEGGKQPIGIGWDWNSDLGRYVTSPCNGWSCWHSAGCNYYDGLEGILGEDLSRG